jgi:CHAP domain
MPRTPIRRAQLVAALIATATTVTWARPSLADDGICGEAAQATIDGIPSYAMCNAATTSNVWSDDGVHTAGSGSGGNWVETEGGNNGYQCTELATRYFYFKWDVTRSWSPGYAKDMCSQALPSSVEKTSKGMHGDLLVVVPGCEGADPTDGHVAVVDDVSGSTISVVQQNTTYNGQPVGTGTFDSSCVLCFLHAVANGAPPMDAGAPATEAGTNPTSPSSDAAPEPDDAAAGAPADASTTEPFDAGPASAPPQESGSGSRSAWDADGQTGGGSCALSARHDEGTRSAWALLVAFVAVALTSRTRIASGAPRRSRPPPRDASRSSGPPRSTAGSRRSRKQ